MKKPDQQKRTCVRCGITKLLNAFLLTTGTKGAVYGTVCLTCRSTISSPGKQHESDDRSGDSSRLRIGAKEKIEADQQKKLYIKSLSDAQEKENKKREELNLEKQQTELVKKKEATQRKSFFSTRQKQSLLGGNSLVQQKQSQNQQIQNDIQQKQEQQQKQETQIAEEGREQQQRLTNHTDTHRMYAKAQLGIRSQAFEQFERWMGKRSFSQLSQLYQKPEQNKSKEPSVDSTKKGRPKGG